MAKQKKRKRRNKHPIALALLIALLVISLAGLLLGTRIYMQHTDASFFTALRQTLHLGGQYIANTLSSKESAIPVNPYHAGDYYRRGDFIQCAASEASVVGIDVSSHQEDIDWQAVADAGVGFAIIRVGYRGYSEGDIFTDSKAAQNIEGAAAAGLDVGVYFYSQAVTEQEAVEEAQFLLNAIDGYAIRYPVVFDWEGVSAENSRTAYVTGPEMTKFAKAFCAEVEQAGYTAGVYFNQSYGYNSFDLHTLKDYEFWLAEYDDAQDFAYEVQLWQYDCEATVPGVSTAVDLNLSYKDYGKDDEA